MRILVTGGVRSGKSTHAEALIGDEPATYVAAGPDARRGGGPRLGRPRRRPPGPSPRLVDDRRDPGPGRGRPPGRAAGARRLPRHLADRAHRRVGRVGAGGRRCPRLVVARTDELAAAVRGCDHHVVLVTNEVGLGVVPEHRSGRLFRDLLGTVNQRVAAACDEVHLVVAGRVLRL